MMSPMKYNRLSVAVMFAGFVLWVIGITCIHSESMAAVFMAGTIVCVIAGVVIHAKYARCPECGKHLTRIWGNECLHCGSAIEQLQDVNK